MGNCIPLVNCVLIPYCQKRRFNLSRGRNNHSIATSSAIIVRYAYIHVKNTALGVDVRGRNNARTHIFCNDARHCDTVAPTHGCGVGVHHARNHSGTRHFIPKSTGVTHSFTSAGHLWGVNGYSCPGR